MACLHPGCLRGSASAGWSETLDQLGFVIKTEQRELVLSRLEQLGAPGQGEISFDRVSARVWVTLLDKAPCLFTQASVACSAQGVVHLAECTIGEDIGPQNVVRAFEIQHPTKGEPFMVAPLVPCTSAGDVSEALCSSLLASVGVPAMRLDKEKWPIWQMPGHILLNVGKMNATKAFGDILIPAAPTNMIISVKTETAKERLLYSANAIEAVGFGFFKDAKEFWTKSRMRLYKRMGFTAIYMPPETLAAVEANLAEKGLQSHAVNLNGTALYRSLTDFGADMLRIVGKTTLDL